METYLVIKDKSIIQSLKPHVCVEELVLSAQRGNKDAFTLIYREYVHPVYRYIYVRVGNHTEQAEDLTQEVFLRALKNIGQYRDNGKTFAGWLFRIAHNLVIDHYRHTKNSRYIPLTETMNIIAEDDPVTDLEQSADVSDIKQAIEKLPAQQREVIFLRFVTGLSVAETATAIEKTEGTVKKLQHVALGKLRELVRK